MTDLVEIDLVQDGFRRIGHGGVARHAVEAAIEEIFPIAPLRVAREQQVFPAETEQDHQTLVVERLVGRDRLGCQHVGLRVVDPAHDLVGVVDFEGARRIGIVLGTKRLRERPGFLFVLLLLHRAGKILLRLVGHLDHEIFVDRRTKNLRREPGIDQVLWQLRSIARLVVVGRHVLETMEHLQGFVVAAAGRTHDARDVLGHAQELFGDRIGARGKPRLQPVAEMIGHGGKIGLEALGFRVCRIFEPRHPDPSHLDLAEQLAAGAESRNVIGMAMRHDDE